MNSIVFDEKSNNFHSISASLNNFYQNKAFFRVKNDIFSYNLVSFDKKLEFQSTENFDDFEVGKSGVLVLKGNKVVKKTLL